MSWSKSVSSLELLLIFFYPLSQFITFFFKSWKGWLGWRDKNYPSPLTTYWAGIPHVQPPALLWGNEQPVLQQCKWRLLTAPASAAASAQTVETCSTRNSSTTVGAPLFHPWTFIWPLSHLAFSVNWAEILCLLCSRPVWVAPSSAARALQGRRRSARGAELGSGAQANQAPPHHFHRGAAGRARGAVPAEPVSGCKHQGEAGTEHTPEGGESRGTFHWSVSGSLQAAGDHSAACVSVCVLGVLMMNSEEDWILKGKKIILTIFFLTLKWVSHTCKTEWKMLKKDKNDQK